MPVEVVIPCGWEGNRRSGVTLSMRYRPQWFIRLQAYCLRKGDEHPTYTPHGHTLPLICGTVVLHLCLHCFCAFSDLMLFVGWQEGHLACKKTGMVICLERGADLHMAQLMPLPLTVSCFSKIQIGFIFLVPAHLGSPGQRAVKRVCVCVTGKHKMVNVTVNKHRQQLSLSQQMFKITAARSNTHRKSFAPPIDCCVYPALLQRVPHCCNIRCFS